MTEVALAGGWVDWREADDDPDPDDELLPATPEDVVRALGFDPAATTKAAVSTVLKAAKSVRKISINPDRASVNRHKEELASIWKKHLPAIGRKVAAIIRPELATIERAITPDQARRAAEIANNVDLSGLDVLIDPTAEKLESMFKDSGSEVIAQLQPSDPNDMFERVNTRAADWAKERAAELVGRGSNPRYAIDDTTRDKIRNVIANGLESGDGNQDITDRIEELGFGEDRAELIAFTEISRANSQGALGSYKEAEEDGLRVQKEWLTAQDDLVCEAICQENEDDGPIDLDDDFSSGDDAPPGHPNCRCRLVASVEGEETSSDEGEAE